MTRDEATKMVELLVQAQNALEAAENFVSNSMADKAERDSLRKTLTTALGTIVGDALVPTVALYPDLDPFARNDRWPRR